jgi:hypothetical protein
LPQAFEHLAPELGQLVQEKHPVVGQGDFAGCQGITATHQSRMGRAVVW